LPDYQVAFIVDGHERTRWHFGGHYPRPFLYPLLGPSGVSLTGMGHPGAPDHDHHRSVWFAHHKLLGIDFWSDNTAARIRQQQWLAYEDGDEEAIMAVRLGWYDGHDPEPLVLQQLVVAVRPADASDRNWHETLIELQASLMPVSDTIEFGQSNFGFFAVRVARNISAHFGGGLLTSSEGRAGEPEIFGRAARWMDYSGPAAVFRDRPDDRREGLTLFDHPHNPNQPTHWHVRDDGWMGPSACMHQPLTATKQKPIQLRYLLHAHAGTVQPKRANAIADDFANSASFTVKTSTAPHRSFSVSR
jgi:hypothetical protein